MPSQTKFSKEWLTHDDGQGHKIKDWCFPSTSSLFHGFCFICQKKVSVANRGESQLLSHASSSIHTKNAKAKICSKQSKFFSKPSAAGVDVADVSLELPSTSQKFWQKTHSDNVTMAEIIWTYKMVDAGFSFNSNHDITTVMEHMFPDSKICKDVTMGPNKMSYEISHGLAPYHHANLVKDVKSAEFYSLTFDEATTDIGKKQLDVHVRFWSNETSNIENRFFTCYELGHATADILLEKVNDCLNGLGDDSQKLDWKSILMIGSDGPVVNKRLWKDLDTQLRDKGHAGLVDIGTCNLHIIHNSFGAGMKEVDHWGVDDLLDSLFKWFHKYPARNEDLGNIQTLLELEGESLLRYVENRWLSIVPVITRVLQQWESLHNYFVCHVPKNLKTALKSNAYKSILPHFTDPLTKVQLLFLKSVGEMYEKFETLFQSDVPLIHLLFTEFKTLTKNILMRFVKQPILDGGSIHKIDISKTENLRPSGEIEIGSLTKRVLTSSVTDKNKRDMFYREAGSFLKRISTHLLNKLPFDNKLLKNIQCLDPEMRAEPLTKKMIKRVGELMPQVIRPDDVDRLVTEWTMYRIDPAIKAPQNKMVKASSVTRHRYNETRKMMKNLTAAGDIPADVDEGDLDKMVEVPMRVDEYWNQMFILMNESGVMKYPLLSKLVKAALTLSHGNAHVERGFSMNKRLARSERSHLKEHTIRSLRQVLDVVKFHGGASKVPIDKGTVSSFRAARNKYTEYLQAEKKKAEKHEKEKTEHADLQKKRKIEDEVQALQFQESDLFKKQEQAQELIDNGLKMINEANKRGPRDQTFRTNMNLGTSLLNTGNDKLKKITSELSCIREKLQGLNMKRKKMV